VSASEQRARDFSRPVLSRATIHHDWRDKLQNHRSFGNTSGVNPPRACSSRIYISSLVLILTKREELQEDGASRMALRVSISLGIDASQY
jgi:hypothetical protein